MSAGSSRLYTRRGGGFVYFFARVSLGQESCLHSVFITCTSTSLLLCIFGKRNLASFITPSTKTPMSAYIGLTRALPSLCCSACRHAGMSFLRKDCNRAGPLPVSVLWMCHTSLISVFNHQKYTQDSLTAAASPPAAPRSWCRDSGAFSVYTPRKTVIYIAHADPRIFHSRTSKRICVRRFSWSRVCGIRSVCTPWMLWMLAKPRRRRTWR